MAPLRIDGPYRLIFRLQVFQYQRDHASLEIRQNIEIRELTNTKSRHAGFDDRLPAVAAKPPFGVVELRVIPVPEMPSVACARDALMSNAARSTLDAVMGRCLKSSQVGGCPSE